MSAEESVMRTFPFVTVDVFPTGASAAIRWRCFLTPRVSATARCSRWPRSSISARRPSSCRRPMRRTPRACASSTARPRCRSPAIQCRHRLGACRHGPRPRRPAALRGDRGPGRGSYRRCRRRHFRRPAASVPRTENASRPGRGLRRHRPSDVVVTSHRPVAASVGNAFVVAEVTPAALTRAAPDLARFKAAHEVFAPRTRAACAIYLYAHDGKSAEATRLRAPHVLAVCPARSRMRPGPAPRRRSPPCCCRSARRTRRALRHHPGASRWAGRACLPARLGARPTASAPASGGGCVPVLKGEISL